MAGLNGKSLGGFKILEQIDEESGQGIVCKAICEVENPCVAVRKGRIVALKVMPVRDDEQRQQWRRLESRTKELVRIDHPNVVRYYGCFCEQGEWNQLHVIVQEFLEGETLKDRLKRFPSGLDVDEGLKVIALALEGLSHTASRGIVHRDIKPGNIFVCENAVNGRKELSVKLIDFEVARQGHGSTTASTGNLRGSFNYMAPEFLDARFRGDLLSDVFSMGVTLHETLTGKLPYDLIDGNGDDAILDFVARWKGVSDGKNPVVICPDVNRLLAHTDKLFCGCLSPAREQRFCSFEEFRNSLRSVRFRTLTNPASGNAYQILQFVGKGGFGEVFKARESKTGQIVAIKHLRRAKYADRFKREAKILSRFADDCFVRFVESFSRDMDGKIQEFLVMGFLDGMPGNSLWDAIKKSKGAGLPAKDVFTAFTRYAHGLRMLHAAGIFHRDIKPSNLYFPAGRPELAAIMDLGIARDTKGTMTVGSVPGTPDYMPPEVVTAGSRGESGMDIYALGLCMYEALTAKPAFARLPSDIDGFRKLVERFRAKERPHFDECLVDPDLLDLLSGMTAFNPEHRIKDARDVERKLLEFLSKLGSGLESVPISAALQKGMPKKMLRGFEIVVGVGALMYGVLLFAFPLGKRIYAEKRLAAVLDSYEKFDPDAANKANEWIDDFNPRSGSWFCLEEAVYAKYASAIEEKQRKISTERAKEDWLRIIDCCVSRDGKLAVDVFEELDARALPDGFAVDGLIKPKLHELGRSVWRELERCLSRDDIKGRRARLDVARKILANHWTAKVLDVDEMRHLRESLDSAEKMCVGNVYNGCGDRIEVCGVKIGVGETKAIVVEDGKPERQFVKRLGFKPVPLPPVFDGMDFRIDDSIFIPESARLSVPMLSGGYRFFLDGREYAGGESIELKPGRYAGKYVRDDETPAGVRIYKDCFVEFLAASGEEVMIPAPDNWEYTDGYKAVLASPVDVEIPELEGGVRCRIDGRGMKSGKLNVVPGKHLCIYEKDDCLAQTNFFETVLGQSLVLPAPRDWVPTQDVERLRDAAQLAARGLWAKVEEAMRGVNVVASENIEEFNRLKAGVSEWEESEKTRRQNEAREFHGKIAALLMTEPVKGRRRRLADAQAIVDGETARKILSRSELKSLRNDILRAKESVAGRIKNDCGFDFSVNGIALAPGESRVIEYDGVRFRGVIARAKGYEDKMIGGEELDGNEIAISDGQWTMSDVPVTLLSATDGVECLFDGKRVNGVFKVSPGRYELLFKRSGYEPQTVGFVANISEGCTVEAPRKWTPLPVEVSLPKLKDGVKCFLGGSEVSGTVKLPPGRQYEFLYRKDDCVDQHVKVLVEAGTSPVAPAPSFWVDTEDVKRLCEAERFLAEGKLSEAKKSIVDIKLEAAANIGRLKTLKEKLAKWVKIKDCLAMAELSYTPEDLLGGSARDCIKYYFDAVLLGYSLNEIDRKRIKHCYEVGMDDLKEQRRRAIAEREKYGRSRYNTDEIDKEMLQLNEWYHTLLPDNLAN